MRLAGVVDILQHVKNLSVTLLSTSCRVGARGIYQGDSGPARPPERRLKGQKGQPHSAPNCTIKRETHPSLRAALQASGRAQDAEAQPLRP
eukprot:4285212-Prymnesium_polylepis.1